MDKEYRVSSLEYVYLGRSGENLARTVKIDVSEWLDRWPGASIHILHRPRGSEGYYIADTTLGGLAVAGGTLLNGMAGRTAAAHGCAAEGCSENHVVNRYEAAQAARIAQRETEVKLRDANIYTEAPRSTSATRHMPTGCCAPGRPCTTSLSPGLPRFGRCAMGSNKGRAGARAPAFWCNFCAT